MEALKTQTELTAFGVIGYRLKGSSGQLTIAPCTAIIGDIQSGKSTILDAFRLAISKKYPRGNRPQDIAELLSGEETGSAYAEIQSPTSTARWSIKATEGGASRPKWEPTGVLANLSADQIDQLILSDEVLAMASAESSATRLAVFRRFGTNFDSALSRLNLTEGEQSEVGRLQHTSPNPVDRIAAEVEGLSSSVRTYGAQIGAIEREINTLDGDEIGGTEEVPDLERELGAAEEFERNQELQTRIAFYDQTNVTAVRLIEELKGELPGLKERAEKAEAELNTHKAKLAFGTGILSLLKTAITKKMNCPCCDSTTFNAQAEYDKKRPLVEQRDRQTQEAASLANKARQDYLTLERRMIQVQGDIMERDREIARLRAQVRPVVEVPKRTAVQIRERLDQLRPAIERKRRLKELLDQRRQLRTKQDDARSAGEKVKRLITDFIESARVEAERTVNRYMLDGMRARLILTETQCRWGVVSKGGTRSHRVMCESERTSLMIALAIAWGAKFILLDDRELAGLSASGVRHLLSKLRDFQKTGHITQVLVTRHKDRRAEIPEGYAEIEVGS